MSLNFSTHYMDDAVFNLSAVIETAREQLAGVDFDTIVGTGFSGGVVIPALALAMDKKFVLIRKDGDDSHHGPGRLLGALGSRWIFVDDLVSSGRTQRRVMERIAEYPTELAGRYLYMHTWDYGKPVFEAYRDGKFGSEAAR